MQVCAAQKHVIMLHFVLRTSAATLHLGCWAGICSRASELIDFIFHILITVEIKIIENIICGEVSHICDWWFLAWNWLLNRNKWVPEPKNASFYPIIALSSRKLSYCSWVAGPAAVRMYLTMLGRIVWLWSWSPQRLPYSEFANLKCLRYSKVGTLGR